MKKLSEVTKEDAIAILSVGYHFFHTGRWMLTDETAAIKEPCKKLTCIRKAFLFWFMDDCIDIEKVPDDNDGIGVFESSNYDVKFACYLKAVELGYYVPGLSLIKPTITFSVIQKFMDENRAWTDATFGKLGPVATLEHLKKEVQETIDSINDEQTQTSSEKQAHTIIEFADCYLLLLNAASKYGISFMVIHLNAMEKMEVNRTRKWGKPNEKGFVEHIKE